MSGNVDAVIKTGGSGLAWSDGEIVRHYLNAKEKWRMIGILAELNNTSYAKIKMVLKNAGIEPEKPPKRRTDCPPKTKLWLVRGGQTYTMKQIVKRCGIPYATLWRRVKNGGTVVAGGKEYKVVICDERR